MYCDGMFFLLPEYLSFSSPMSVILGWCEQAYSELVVTNFFSSSYPPIIFNAFKSVPSIVLSKSSIWCFSVIESNNSARFFYLYSRNCFVLHLPYVMRSSMLVSAYVTKSSKLDLYGAICPLLKLIPVRTCSDHKYISSSSPRNLFSIKIHSVIPY